jgi:hypothetical protein
MSKKCYAEFIDSHMVRLSSSQNANRSNMIVVVPKVPMYYNKRLEHFLKSTVQPLPYR